MLNVTGRVISLDKGATCGDIRKDPSLADQVITFTDGTGAVAGTTTTVVSGRTQLPDGCLVISTYSVDLAYAKSYTATVGPSRAGDKGVTEGPRSRKALAAAGLTWDL